MFKDTGKGPAKLMPPLGTHYRLKQLLETIKHLPNRFNILSHANFAIYVLHDYAVHLMSEVRLLVISNKYVKIDVKPVSKSVWVTNAFDGSQDYLVSD